MKTTFSSGASRRGAAPVWLVLAGTRESDWRNGLGFRSRVHLQGVGMPDKELEEVRRDYVAAVHDARKLANGIGSSI